MKKTRFITGASAEARTIGVEKTRLSRRIAALERRLGVRLLQRTTPALALTEAGQRFFERCVPTVEGAQTAYDRGAELRGEPAGLVRLSRPVLLTQGCLAHALPGYMTVHPKVSIFVEATDRTASVIVAPALSYLNVGEAEATALALEPPGTLLTICGFCRSTCCRTSMVRP